MLLHLFTVACCVSMIWLGHWQWTAAHRHHGEIRNYAYAFQWWAFTGFAVLMWWRIVRDYLHPERADAETPVRPAAPHYVGYQPPPPALDDDPERVRFNAYLADLHARDLSAREIPGREGPAPDREEAR
jgi:hypothetical protein